MHFFTWISAQSQIEKLDLLDTEYAAIVAANWKADGEALYHPATVINDIASYRNATKQSAKDTLLYRLGNCLELFSIAEAEALAQHNRKLNNWQRQRVKEVLFERFGVTLS